MEENKKYMMGCNLAGTQYHGAIDVWDKLKIGTQLLLERDRENKYDPEAVAVMYQDEDNTTCIGYIPRGENSVLAAFMDMGWNNMFECRICRINEHAHPEQQVLLAISIKKKVN